MVTRVLHILFVVQILACPLWCAGAESAEHHHAPLSDCERDHENHCTVESCFCTAPALRPAERFVPRADAVCPVLLPAVAMFQDDDSFCGSHARSYGSQKPPPEHHLPLLI